MLLVAKTERYNSVRPEDHPPHFSWFCGKPEKYNDRWMLPDLCQLLVYPLSQEVEADNMFQLCNERMIKKYHEEEVIYSHDSLDERGVYHSGVPFIHITIPPIFIAGLLFNVNRLMAKSSFDGVIANTNLRWNKITPNDLYENCFDGYSLVRLYGLRQLKVWIENVCWLDLGQKEIKYLSLAGQRFFPFTICPTRLNYVKFSVRWEQPSDMKDTDDEVDHSRSSMKYFFFNQNARSRAATTWWLYDTDGSPIAQCHTNLVSSKIVKFYTRRAIVIIQRWWINICYNPCHPVGKRIISGKWASHHQDPSPVQRSSGRC